MGYVQVVKTEIPTLVPGIFNLPIFFWTVIRTVAVDCRTKGPKFCDLATKFLLFGTVQYRGVFAPTAGM